MVSFLDTYIEKKCMERGIEQKELARLMGIRPQGLSQLKRSRRPHYLTVRRLSEALGVDSSAVYDAVRFLGGTKCGSAKHAVID